MKVAAFLALVLSASILQAIKPEDIILNEIRELEQLGSIVVHNYEWSKTFAPNDKQPEREYKIWRARLAEAKYRFLTGQRTELTFNDLAFLEKQTALLEAGINGILAERRQQQADEYAQQAAASQARGAQAQTQMQLDQMQHDISAMRQAQQQAAQAAEMAARARFNRR